MKRDYRKIYLVEFIIFIYIIISGYILFRTKLNYDYINAGFWIIFPLTIYFFYNFPRDKSFYKSTFIKYIIICLLSYLILIYGIGVFTGFYRSALSHSPKMLIINILPVFIYFFGQEYIRYIIAKNTEFSKKPIIFLTILYIILDMVVAINYYSMLNTGEEFFILVFLVLIPIIMNHGTCSYITYNVGFAPTLIFKGAIELFPLVFPIYPDIGDYLNSLFKLIVPFTIFSGINKYLKYHDKVKRETILKKVVKKLLLIPFVLALITIILLVSGIFKYKMIAIGSGSMQPVYKRGDAVIYIKVQTQEELNDLNVGDIIAFERHDTIITHRITKITKKDGKLIFNTKGDNNKFEDEFETPEKYVRGKITYIIKNIGYPTVILGEYLEGIKK